MINKEKIENAVIMFLEGIGEDPNRDGLKETPSRVARMCEDMFGGLIENPESHLNKTFIVKNNDMVIEKDIVFYSMCEHHLLPFFGKAHIAYVPDGKVAGLSKLPRIVEVYARRPQLQEQMTVQITDVIYSYLKPEGVMVVLEAEHTCLTMRGVKKTGVKTISIATRGIFASDVNRQNQFLNIIKK